jgi:hypothetical protein
VLEPSELPVNRCAAAVKLRHSSLLRAIRGPAYRLSLCDATSAARSLTRKRQDGLVRLDLPDDPEPPDVAIFCRVCVGTEFNGLFPKPERALPRRASKHDPI